MLIVTDMHLLKRFNSYMYCFSHAASKYTCSECSVSRNCKHFDMTRRLLAKQFACTVHKCSVLYTNSIIVGNKYSVSSPSTSVDISYTSTVSSVNHWLAIIDIEMLNTISFYEYQHTGTCMHKTYFLTSIPTSLTTISTNTIDNS